MLQAREERTRCTLLSEGAACRLRASLKSHRRWLAHCDSRRDRAPNRLDHVTLTPGAPASEVTPDALWVSFRPPSKLALQRGWAACAGGRCHARRRAADWL